VFGSLHRRNRNSTAHVRNADERAGKKGRLLALSTVVTFVVSLFPPPAMAGDSVLAALETPSWKEHQRKRFHLQIGLVFWLWQCDKQKRILLSAAIRKLLHSRDWPACDRS
jgi:hypothetical protein